MNVFVSAVCRGVVGDNDFGFDSLVEAGLQGALECCATVAGGDDAGDHVTSLTTFSQYAVSIVLLIWLGCWV